MPKYENVKASTRVIKGQSLMGPQSGPPTVVESEGGKITRIRPYYYEEHNNWEDLNPWTIEAKGRTFTPPKRTPTGNFYTAYKKRVYSNNRVRYPLKRIDWDPNGERHTETRGQAQYERISWDEAATIIAKELLRIRDKYGMSAILAEADMHGEGKHLAPSHGCMDRLLSLLGGYTVQMRNQDSWEGWCWGAKNVWGCEGVGEMGPTGNIWPDIAQNCDMLLLWGADPETTAMGFDGYMPARLSQWIHSLGVKYVYVDPALNYSGVYLADKWIPVLPNTDAALHLAIAYMWLTEGTYEKEYVETHAVGYQEFFDYVLGKVDGEPKTPEWASEKCGVPVWTIKALARDWASKTVSITHGNGGPGIRGPFSSEPGRLEPILLGMRGLGKPGVHQAKWTEWNLFTDIFPMPYMGKRKPDLGHRAEFQRPYNGPLAMPQMMHHFTEEDALRDFADDPVALAEVHEYIKLTTPIPQPPVQAVPKCLVHDAILNGHTEWYGLYSFCGPAEQQWVKHQFPQPGCSTLHAIWTDSPCMVTCWNDGFNFAKAVRSPEIEFIVAQQPWLENDCYFADIILPVQTKFEMEDIGEDPNGGVFTAVFRERQACEPVGESLDDFWCVAAVAKKLDELLEDENETIYNAYTGNKTSIERCIELFWRTSNVCQLDANDDFHKKDIFVVPADPDIQKKRVGLRDFANDPKSQPLSTPTGLLEFTSTAIQKYFPDDEERPPYPKWVEKSPLHDERLGGERAKRYPLLCMSNHGRWRFHANCDDITWNREINMMKIRAKDGYQYEACWMHPETAKSRGIEFGDIVKVFNERGTVLCGAYVTERVMPGVVYVDHGSRYDPIDPESLDRGGAINLITPHAIISKNCTGMVVSGFLVDCAKVTDEEMDGWKKQYPDAFARKIDEACGVCLDGWMIK